MRFFGNLRGICGGPCRLDANLYDGPGPVYAIQDTRMLLISLCIHREIVSRDRRREGRRASERRGRAHVTRASTPNQLRDARLAPGVGGHGLRVRP
jgi:hypothetical protein